jgi:DNA-binding NtrC family response regulator
VRELKNVAEYFAATLDSGELHAGAIDARLRGGRPSEAVVAKTGFRPLAEELGAIEKARVIEALEAAGGNRTRAAQLLDMPLRTFLTRVKSYGLGAR